MNNQIPGDGGFADNPHRGIASLAFNGRTLRFRTNPNEIWWSYTINTSAQETYGGRVVQILSVRIEDLIIKIDCGRGGWNYLMHVVNFLRQMMIDQRQDGGKTATFNYTTRRWRFKVYALSVPFQDSLDATIREIELRFKVQEDVSGTLSQMLMSSELSRLKNGIGWEKNQYNTPTGGDLGTSPTFLSLTDIPSNIANTFPGISLP